MVISKSNILHFLASERIDLDIFALAVEKKIEIEELSYNRSRMLKITYYENGRETEQPITLFVKQPLDIYDSEYSMPIIREAYFYQTCNQIDSLKIFLPNKRYLSFNNTYYILVRQWIIDVQLFSDSFDSKYLNNIGWLLRLFHRNLNKDILSEELFQQLSSLKGGRPSTFLSIGILDDNFIQFHDTRLYEFIKNEANNKIIEILKISNPKWETSTLIHSDLSENNILVRTEGEKERVHIVDWEYVVWGDIAWDIASIIFYLILKKEFILDKNYKDVFQLFWKEYSSEIEFDKDWRQKVMILIGVKFLDFKLSLETELSTTERISEREKMEKKINDSRNAAEYFILNQPTNLFF